MGSKVASPLLVHLALLLASWSLLASASSQGAPSTLHRAYGEQVVTRVVLLQEGQAGRVRRDVVVPLNSSVGQYGGQEDGQALSRGHPGDTVLEELEHNLEDVDVVDEKLFDKVNQRIDTEGLVKGDNDTHKYYKQDFVPKNQFYTIYQDLGAMNLSGMYAGMVKEHSMLSQSYRRAATINLSFKFPFYGHEVENITIATGGFLYTGDYVHSWLAATQYIAPLMANFDTSNNHQAKIRYLDDGTKLVVEWKDVYLQERESEGPFTFQVTLHKQGDIWFAYQKIPLEIISIKDDDHPVKVGLSDAYIIDRTIYFARRKTIYEYHRLNMKDHEIKNETAIVFKALATCNMNKGCSSCLATVADVSLREDLDCRWCPELQRCSDGTDRNRQDWLKRKCDMHNISSQDVCPLPGQVYPAHNSFGQDDHDYKSHDSEHQSAKMSDYGNDVFPGEAGSATPGAIVATVFSCLLLLTLMGWTGYAYFNPNTSSGRFLIKYRPGAWRWRPSGGRYTAASIHM